MLKAEQFIKEIIGRGIEWFDYKANNNLWRTYFAEANQIANSEVLNNEINHYTADLMKFMTYESRDFDQILHTRTAIITLETLKERLKSIEDPNKFESKEDVHSGI